MSERYEFIDAEYATVAADTAMVPTVTQMCGWLKVSRSGFFEWSSRPDSATVRRRNELKLLIAKAFDDSDGTYGYRRVAAQLARWGVRAGLELVRALLIIENPPAHRHMPAPDSRLQYLFGQPDPVPTACPGNPGQNSRPSSHLIMSGHRVPPCT